jgi:hypothetical protein
VTLGRRLLVGVLLLTSACDAPDRSASTSVGGGDAAGAPVAALPGEALRALREDQAGRLLAEAYRTHLPDAAERRLAAAFWLVAVQGAESGATPELLLSPSLAGTTASLSATYLLASEPAQAADASPLISRPPQCTDDCLPSFGPVVRTGAAAASALLPVTATLRGAAARFAQRLSRRRDLGTLADERLDHLLAEDLPAAEVTETLDRVGRVLIPALAFGRAAADLGLVAAETGALASVGAVVAAAFAGASLGAAIAHAREEWQTCRAWQRNECRSGDEVRADGGVMDAHAVQDISAAAPNDARSADASAVPDDASGHVEPPMNRLSAVMVDNPPWGTSGLQGRCGEPGGPGNTYVGSWPARVRLVRPAGATGVGVRLAADVPEIRGADILIAPDRNEGGWDLEFIASRASTFSATVTATCLAGCDEGAPDVEARISVEVGPSGEAGEPCVP